MNRFTSERDAHRDFEGDHRRCSSSYGESSARAGAHVSRRVPNARGCHSARPHSTTSASGDQAGRDGGQASPLCNDRHDDLDPPKYRRVLTVERAPCAFGVLLPDSVGLLHLRLAGIPDGEQRINLPLKSVGDVGGRQSERDRERLVGTWRKMIRCALDVPEHGRLRVTGRQRHFTARQA